MFRSDAGERETSRGSVFETVHGTRSRLQYHRHGVPFATIVVEGGYCEVRDGMPAACGVGAIVVHGSHEEHSDFFSGPTRCLNVELPHTLALEPFHVLDDEAVHANVRAVARAYYGGAGVEALTSAVAALQRALTLRQRVFEQPRPAWLEATVRRFAWTEPVPLGSAARYAGVHPTHFARSFVQHTGMTPNAYRRRARSRMASDLLLGSDVSLARIALNCGYGDQSHFTNAFTRAAGLSPSAFRRVFSR